MRRNVRALAAIGSVATLLMLAGCAGSVADTTWRGAPAGVELGVDGEITSPVVWIDEDAGRFAVVTGGSSSCVPVAREIASDAADEVSIRFDPPSRDVCTADMALTTHEFTLPDGVVERPVRVALSGEGWESEHVLE